MSDNITYKVEVRLIEQRESGEIVLKHAELFDNHKMNAELTFGSLATSVDAMDAGLQEGTHGGVYPIQRSGR
jgi:hypothetical protein